MLSVLPFSVMGFRFLKFSATAFFSLVGFWLPFVVGFSDAGEGNAFLASLNFTVLQLWTLVGRLVSPTAAHPWQLVRVRSFA